MRDRSNSISAISKVGVTFCSTIPSREFPAEQSRYVLYVSSVCPWSHRTVLARALKGLEDIVQIVQLDARDSMNGWFFSGCEGLKRDPVNGIKWLKELYLKADPLYRGRVTVPVLWDTQKSKEFVVRLRCCLTTSRHHSEQRQRRNYTHTLLSF